MQESGFSGISENHRDMSPILSTFRPKTVKNAKSCAYGWSKPVFGRKPGKPPYPHNAGFFLVFSAEIQEILENPV